MRKNDTFRGLTDVHVYHLIMRLLAEVFLTDVGRDLELVGLLAADSLSSAFVKGMLLTLSISGRRAPTDDDTSFTGRLWLKSLNICYNANIIN